MKRRLAYLLAAAITMTSLTGPSAVYGAEAVQQEATETEEAAADGSAEAAVKAEAASEETTAAVETAAPQETQAEVQPAQETQAEQEARQDQQAAEAQEAPAQLQAVQQSVTESEPETVTTTERTAKWAKTKAGWKWKYSDGTYESNAFIEDKGNTYYIGKDQVMKTGLFEVGGEKYYASASGSMKTGWIKITNTVKKTQKVNGKNKTVTTKENKYYYMDPATFAARKGITQIDGATYHFDKNGVETLATGWKKVDGIWYYLEKVSEGRVSAKTGWLKSGRKYYYLGADGAMVTGWLTLEDKTYYLDAVNGDSVTGKLVLEDQTYYLPSEDGKGVLAGDGWNSIGGKQFYLDPETHAPLAGRQMLEGKIYFFDGETGESLKGVQKETFVMDDGTETTANYLYMPDEDGRGVLAESAEQAPVHATFDGKAYLVNSDGSLVLGLVTEDGVTRNYTLTGLTTGWLQLDGVWYYFDASGKRLEEGWKKLGSTWYYLQPGTGAAQTDWATIDGKKFYFNPTSCAMVSGIVTISGKTYYFDTNGALHTKAETITYKGAKYTVAKDGTAKPVIRNYIEQMDYAVQKYDCSTGWIIMVDKTNHKVGVYRGSKNNWKRVNTNIWDMSCGAKKTPTKSGMFKIVMKEFVVDFDHSTAFYCSYTTGSYYFHSVLYKQYVRVRNDAQIIDGRMNKNISHSCIRLRTDNAKYIYNNCPKQTKLIVYGK